MALTNAAFRIFRKGSSLSCSVEYAQSQLKPKKAAGGGSKHVTKADTLVGTIESDEHFKQFLAELSAPAAPVLIDADATTTPTGRPLTPLLLAIKQKDQQKFAEKMKARKKKAKKTAAVAKPIAVAPVAKRKKQKKKKPQPAGPQFGAVKILGAAVGTPQTAAPTASAPTASAASAAEPKKKRQRRPKPKKTAGTQVQATPKKVQTAS